MSKLAIMPLSDYTNACNAIRKKTGSTDSIKSSEMERLIESIEASGGGGLEFDRVVKTCTISLKHFDKSDVVLNFENIVSLENFCLTRSRSPENTTVEHLTINCKNPVSSVSSMLCHYERYPSGADNTLTHLTFNVDTSQCFRFKSMCQYYTALTVVDGTPLNFSYPPEETTLEPFVNCPSLVEFRVVENSIVYNFNIPDSPNLSTDTLQSIIDGLLDWGKKSETLTLHATAGAKLTEEQKALITAKNWTLVY